jgi:hypothetical protein
MGRLTAILSLLLLAAPTGAAAGWLSLRSRPDGTLGARQLFTDMNRDPLPGNTDGMKVDSQGNVYCTGAGGVWIGTGFNSAASGCSSLNVLLTANSSGALYGWYDPGSDDLMSIDKTTGVATLVGESGLGTAFHGLAQEGVHRHRQGSVRIQGFPPEGTS